MKNSSLTKNIRFLICPNLFMALLSIIGNIKYLTEDFQ